MLISREREKLLEAIKYFSAKTKYCGLIKVFKLLYFLDFTHFRQTGRFVTGLTYQAWPRGPVPNSLYEEIKAKHSIDGVIAVQEHAEIETATGKSYSPAKFEFKKRFDSKFFTKRELRIMEELAFIFQESTAEQISEASHLKGKPWDTTKRQHGLRAPIDYMLSLDGSDELQLPDEEIATRIEEQQEMRKAFS